MNQASNSSINSVNHVEQDENTFEFSRDDSLFNFSSHLLDHDEFLFNTILPHQTPSQPPPVIIEEEASPAMDRTPSKKGKEKAVTTGSSKRHQGKKDRHSKIYTAQGPRDRRMRLSLQIARKFFDLQDLLGFDKASKTIEWLFNKSKAAIKDLTDKSCALSSPYDYNINNNNSNGGGDDVGSGGGGSRDDPRLPEDEIRKHMGEAILGGPRTKESRAKAREWARKRTKEKLMMKKQGKNINDLDVQVQNPNIIRVSNNNNQNKVQTQDKLEDQMASIGIIERFLASSSTSMSDFHQECDRRRAFGEQIRYNNVGFEDVPGNWEEENGRLSNMGYAFQNPNYALFNRQYNQGN